MLFIAKLQKRILSDKISIARTALQYLTLMVELTNSKPLLNVIHNLFFIDDRDMPIKNTVTYSTTDNLHNPQLLKSKLYNSLKDTRHDIHIIAL